MEIIGQLNVNDESCTNHFAQWAAIEALEGGAEMCKPITDELRVRRDVARDLLNGIEGVSVGSPSSTFYLFPKVTKVVVKKGFRNSSELQEAVLKETGVAFCSRSHFSTPLPDEKEHYVRFAYSGIELDDIREGMDRFKAYCEA